MDAFLTGIPQGMDCSHNLIQKYKSPHIVPNVATFKDKKNKSGNKCTSAYFRVDQVGVVVRYKICQPLCSLQIMDVSSEILQKGLVVKLTISLGLSSYPGHACNPEGSNRLDVVNDGARPGRGQGEGRGA